MNEEMINRLKACGIDYEGAVHRFLDSVPMYIKFLKKFPADPNYAELLECVEVKDYVNAFHHAHTLNGSAANLGIESVRKPAKVITEMLRDKKTEDIDEQTLAEEIKELIEKYAEACAVIQSVEE